VNRDRIKGRRARSTAPFFTISLPAHDNTGDRGFVPPIEGGEARGLAEGGKEVIMSFIRVPAGAIVLTASMALAASSARASNVDVNVPFSFIVSAKALPPGTYHVSVDAQQGKMLVRGLTDGVFVITNHLSVPDTAEPKLVFHRYGEEYVLREVWTGDGLENQLPEPRREKELVQSARDAGGSGSPSEVVVIAAD